MDPALLPALAVGTTAGALATVHCTAMCGPLAVLAGAGRERGRTARFLAGRTAAYAALGAVSGSSGAAVVGALPVRVGSALVTIALTLSLVVVGARLLCPTRTPSEAPVELGRRRTSSTSRLLLRAHAHPFALGAALALLPCGVLWGAVAAASVAGSAAAGAAGMVAFAVTSSLGLALAGRVARLDAVLDDGTRRALGAVLFAGAAVLALRPWLSSGASPACHGEAGVHSTP